MIAAARRLASWGIVAGLDATELEAADRGRVVARHPPSVTTRAMRAASRRAVTAMLRDHAPDR